MIVKVHASKMSLSLLNGLPKIEAECQKLWASGALLEESNHRKMDANISAKSVSCGAACVDSGLRQVDVKKCETVTHTHTDIYIFCVKEINV